MPAPMPSFADALLGARFSDDPIVMLITITHPAGETVRLARYPEDITSRGEVFKSSWYEVNLVNDDGNLPSTELSVPNVANGAVGRMYFRQAEVPLVTIEVIALSHPDEPITDIRKLELTGIGIDPVFVTGRLTGKDHSAEPYGTIAVVPSRFPALFRRPRKT